MTRSRVESRCTTIKDDDMAARHTHEQANAMMASELNSLTRAERSTLLEDVHGVGDLPPEESNPSLIQEKLRQMNHALFSIPVKLAFDEAQRLCGGKPGGLVNDPSFRIRFLRAERYNAREAAIRMVSNLEALRETFGQEALVRPIHLSDMMLDRENQGPEPFLFSGNCFQVMPFRDRLGRRIIVRSGRKLFTGDEVDVKTRIKAFLFICQELADDIECQIKGTILIGFPLERTEMDPSIDGSVIKILQKISQKIVPVRIAAFHICIADHPWFRLFSSLLLQALPIQFRLRSRIHMGSVDECCYKLMAYGIPGDQIPIKSSGIIKNADHKRFIAYCQEREDAVFGNGVEFRGIYCPSSKDILVGRGPRIKNHIGNEMYRTLLQTKYEQYNSASMNQKREIACELIRAVHACGGRFLIPAKNGWMEVDTEVARVKVSIAFRDVRKTLNAKRNRNYTNSVSKELSAEKKMDIGCL